MVLAADLLQDRGAVVIDINGHHIHPGSKDTLNGQIVELQGRGNQVSVFLIQTALFRHVFNNVVDLIFCYGYFRVSLGQPAGRVADGSKKSRRRPEQSDQDRQQIDAPEGQVLTVFLGDTFRKHFTDKEDDHGSNKSTDGDRGQSPSPRYSHGNNRRGSQMCDIGTDQNGTDRTVKMLQGIQYFGCPAVPVIGQQLHADP